MLTAPKISENEMIRYKSAKETSLLEIKEVERGKPREWETQILVGELVKGNKELITGCICIDKCLSPYMVQNMAY